MRKGQRVASAWINSQQAAEVAKYYTQGHSVKEAAEKFGVSTIQVNNLAKKRGLTNGMTWLGRNSAVETRAKEAEQRIAVMLPYLGFDYLGGYETSQSKCRIKCRACGAEYERTVGFLRKGNVTCVECKKQETKKRKVERELEAEAKKAERDLYRMMHPPKDAYAEQHERFLMRSGICEICGKPYTVREYVESCALKKAQDNGVCSRECRDEKKRRKCRAMHKGRKDTHRHRARKYGCEYDSSVKLDRLIKRNGLQCAICGGMCDLNDHSWSEYSGPLYPSIDHIIPMSKGGSHTWDNVQIAHIICNSEKGDRMEEANA